ncbi:hypothetical protein HDU87_002722 [Geranomyces variabilis]|uniref:PROP1-like PPR domain-containing protein n=1 Tax=Geranomyces variabilis TaxID=109894 RepID=A0AAD5TTP9_9FUNG|nr:hypothetical protein HDU87_002722 [Geranomyces variabilis]
MDSRLCRAAIDLHARAGEIAKAERLLHALLRARIVDPHVSFYNVLLRAYVRARDTDGVTKVVRWMRERDVTADAYTHVWIMQHCIKDGDGHGAIAVYDDAVRCGITPVLRMRGLLVAAYLLERNVAAALAVCRTVVKERDGNLPKPMYGAMIDGLSKMGLLDDAAEFINAMRESNMRPNVQIYTMLMHAHARRGDLEGARRWQVEMDANGVAPDPHAYGVLIWIALRLERSYETAVAIVAKMRAQGFAPTPHIITMFADGLCRSGFFKEASALLAPPREGEKNPLPLSRKHPPAPTSSTDIGGTSYMHALTHTGPQGIHEACRLFRKLVTKSTPDVVTYTVLIDAMARSADTLHLAHELYGDMRAAAIRPDAVVFNILLAAHVRFRGVASSLDVLHRMRDAGVMPTVHTFTILVWMYVRERRRGRLGTAPASTTTTTMAVPTSAIANDAASEGNMYADTDHHIRSFSALARAYARKGDTLTLRRLLDEISYQGVVPDATLFYHLLVASAGVGESSSERAAAGASAAAMTAAVVAEMRLRGLRLDSRCRGVLADVGLMVVNSRGDRVALRDRNGKIWPG